MRTLDDTIYSELHNRWREANVRRLNDRVDELTRSLRETECAIALKSQWSKKLGIQPNDLDIRCQQINNNVFGVRIITPTGICERRNGVSLKNGILTIGPSSGWMAIPFDNGRPNYYFDRLIDALIYVRFWSGSPQPGDKMIVLNGSE